MDVCIVSDSEGTRVGRGTRCRRPPSPRTVAITPLDPVGADRAELIALLTGSAWPFPVRPHVTRPVAKEAIEDGGRHHTMLGHQLPM